jgi:molybdenum cofactor biosynthesis enzyme MoaA
MRHVAASTSLTTSGPVRHTKGIWAADEDSLPYLSTEQIDRPPIKLILSLVGFCNLRCFHCLGSSEEIVTSSQDRRSASPELVDFIVDRVVPEVRAIRFGGVGYTEQLTSRTFDYFMERVRPHAPQLGFFELVTNLSIMTEQRADLLARSLTDISISLEGIGDNFTRLRGLPWSRLVKHIQMLREAKQRNPATRMKINLLVCAMANMFGDLLRFDVFKSLGVECIILSASSAESVGSFRLR